MKMVNTIPLEHAEQVAFVDWLERKGLRFTSIPNSTYVDKRMNPRLWGVLKRNKKAGLRLGFPDMVVLTPKGLVCVEMKRLKGSTTSEEQKEWIKAINETPGTEAAVCKGCNEAIRFVERFL